jgi:hypothetical protein
MTFLFLVRQSPVDQGLLIHEVCRSHTMTHHNRYDSSGRAISLSQRPQPGNTQQSRQTNIHTPGGIRTQNLSRRAAADLQAGRIKSMKNPMTLSGTEPATFRLVAQCLNQLCSIQSSNLMTYRKPSVLLGVTLRTAVRSTAVFISAFATASNLRLRAR